MDLTQTDGRWECRVVAPGWPELTAVAVRFDTPAQAKPTAAQLNEAERLGERAVDVRGQVERGLAANARLYWVEQMNADDESADAVAEGSVYWGRLQGVVVWQPEGGVTRVGFDFESVLDENEHGVGVLWAAGRVLTVGSAEQSVP